MIMKKLFTLFLMMLLPLMASAQIERTINVATAGTLSSYISDDEKYQIEKLTLTGEINGDDIGFIREMAGGIRWSHKNDVQSGIACRYARHVTIIFGSRLHNLLCLLNQWLHMHVILLDIGLGNVIQHAFSLAYHVLHVAGLVKRFCTYNACICDELSG